MSGFPLTGVDPADPTPGIVREIRFAQGVSTGGTATRDVVLLCNITSAGSLTGSEDTVTDALADRTDCIAKAGPHSEALLMFDKYSAVDPSANIHLLPIAVGTGIATVDFTFATNSDSATAMKIDLIGESTFVGVAKSDTPTTVAAACAAAINAQFTWPVSALSSAGVLTVNASVAGKRHTHYLDHIRITNTTVSAVPMTVTKGSVTAGTTDASMSNALTALSQTEIYYQVSPCKVITATDTDHALGEHSAMITTQALPVNGKSQVLIAGSASIPSDVRTVALALNNPLAFIYHAENNDWSPAMIAAQCAAVQRLKETAHPGSSLVDYGRGTGDILNVPDPFLKTDRPTASEIRAYLNEGVTPLNFTAQGKSYIVRHVTTKSLTNSIADYRARSGHIPSVMHDLWFSIFESYFTQKQQFVADDPADGEKPLQQVEYPRTLKAIIVKVINDKLTRTGGPTLDPSFADEMKASVQVVRLPDGLSAKLSPVAVKHNNKGQFLIEESSSSV